MAISRLDVSDPSRGRFPVPDFRLRIPVASFRCGNRIMDGDMRRALRAAAHSHVQFTLRGQRGGIEHDLDRAVYRATIVGDLALAGQTRTIDVDLAAERISRTSFRIRAAQPLQMTDSGVTPPAALFGAIRARDNLTVSFDLVLELAADGRVGR
jgi:hypothetical protein